MAFRILSLCSGIGGLDLGVELAFPGSRVVGHVEREAFPASVLLARMEDETLGRAPVWCGDLRALDARPMRGHVDLVTAGYPCQPFSVAGKRGGDQDPRHLWPEVARVIGEVGPDYVFLENVPGHLRLGFDAVLGDLADLGFDAEWTVVGADDVGAPHRRKRLFVLARRVSDTERNTLRDEPRGERPERPERLESKCASAALARDMVEDLADCQQDGRGQADGDRGGVGREEREEEGREPEPGGAAPTLDRPGGVMADAEGLEHAHRPRLEGPGHAEPGGRAEPTRTDRPLWPPGPAPELWAGIEASSQPAIRGVADGTARGLERSQLAALGNGVVPLAAANALRTLWNRLTPNPKDTPC